jgi:hypothetical protein
MRRHDPTAQSERKLPQAKTNKDPERTYDSAEAEKAVQSSDETPTRPQRKNAQKVQVSAEARTRWAMLKSLAGVGKPEDDDESLYGVAKATQEGARDAGELESGSQFPLKDGNGENLPDDEGGVGEHLDAGDDDSYHKVGVEDDGIDQENKLPDDLTSYPTEEQDQQDQDYAQSPSYQPQLDLEPPGDASYENIYEDDAQETYPSGEAFEQEAADGDYYGQNEESGIVYPGADAVPADESYLQSHEENLGDYDAGAYNASADQEIASDLDFNAYGIPQDHDEAGGVVEEPGIQSEFYQVDHGDHDNMQLSGSSEYELRADEYPEPLLGDYMEPVFENDEGDILGHFHDEAKEGEELPRRVEGLVESEFGDFGQGVEDVADATDEYAEGQNAHLDHEMEAKYTEENANIEHHQGSGHKLDKELEATEHRSQSMLHGEEKLRRHAEDASGSAIRETGKEAKRIIHEPVGYAHKAESHVKNDLKRAENIPKSAKGVLKKDASHLKEDSKASGSKAQKDMKDMKDIEHKGEKVGKAGVHGLEYEGHALGQDAKKATHAAKDLKLKGEQSAKKGAQGLEHEAKKADHAVKDLEHKGEKTAKASVQGLEHKGHALEQNAKKAVHSAKDLEHKGEKDLEHKGHALGQDAKKATHAAKDLKLKGEQSAKKGAQGLEHEAKKADHAVKDLEHKGEKTAKAGFRGLEQEGHSLGQDAKKAAHAVKSLGGKSEKDIEHKSDALEQDAKTAARAVKAKVEDGVHNLSGDNLFKHEIKTPFEQGTSRALQSADHIGNKILQDAKTAKSDVEHLFGGSEKDRNQHQRGQHHEPTSLEEKAKQEAVRLEEELRNKAHEAIVNEHKRRSLETSPNLLSPRRIFGEENRSRTPSRTRSLTKNRGLEKFSLLEKKSSPTHETEAQHTNPKHAYTKDQNLQQQTPEIHSDRKHSPEKPQLPKCKLTTKIKDLRVEEKLTINSQDSEKPTGSQHADTRLSRLPAPKALPHVSAQSSPSKNARNRSPHEMDSLRGSSRASASASGKSRSNEPLAIPTLSIPGHTEEINKRSSSPSRQSAMSQPPLISKDIRSKTGNRANTAATRAHLDKPEPSSLFRKDGNITSADQPESLSAQDKKVEDEHSDGELSSNDSELDDADEAQQDPEAEDEDLSSTEDDVNQTPETTSENDSHDDSNPASPSQATRLNQFDDESNLDPIAIPDPGEIVLSLLDIVASTHPPNGMQPSVMDSMFPSFVATVSSTYLLW